MNRTHLTRFVIVGLTTNGLLLVVFWLAVNAGVPSLVAVTGIYALGLLASLILNGKWTFGTLRRDTALGSTLRFSVLYGLGYFYSMAAFWLLSLTKLIDVVDQCVVMASCAGLMFLGQKYWVFKSRSAGK